MRSRRAATSLALVVLAVMGPGPQPLRGQMHDARHARPDTGLTAAALEFIDEATAASLRFRSRTEAIRSGYRRLGPDFPGMGEHWVNPGLVVQGVLDPARPPVLSYTVVDGEPELVGVAFTLPLGPDDHPPEEPFPGHVWHDHSERVDEETLLLNHPASMHASGSGHRLSMVHIWTVLENPDGVLAQNNWHLPFFRSGLTPPAQVTSVEARGVSLAHGGRDFHWRLIERAATLSPEEKEAVQAAIHAGAARAEALVDAARAQDGAVVDPAPFGVVWSEFWARVRGEVRPETWASLRMLAGGR